MTWAFFLGGTCEGAIGVAACFGDGASKRGLGLGEGARGGGGGGEEEAGGRGGSSAVGRADAPVAGRDGEEKEEGRGFELFLIASALWNGVLFATTTLQLWPPDFAARFSHLCLCLSLAVALRVFLCV